MGMQQTQAESRFLRSVDSFQDWIGAECINQPEVGAYLVNAAHYELPVSDMATPVLVAVLMDGDETQAVKALHELRSRYLADHAKSIAKLAQQWDEEVYEFTSQDAKTLHADEWRAEQKDMRAAGGM